MAAKLPPSKAPPGNAPPPAKSLGAPNQTLFISNLPDKIQKVDLRRSLYLLFSTYGPVLDVVAMKTAKMRGQAHVVFRDIQTSTQAMRALQGFDFFGRELRIQYGKGKSDTIAKLDGTFRIPVTAAAPGTSTELQQSIFSAPGAGAASSKPTNGDVAMVDGEKGSHGQKRTRDEEDEDEQDAPMEEDEDDAMAMDESDDD